MDDEGRLEIQDFDDRSDPQQDAPPRSRGRQRGSRPRTYRLDLVRAMKNRDATTEMAEDQKLVEQFHPLSGGKCPRLDPVLFIDGQEITLLRSDGWVACPWAGCPMHLYLQQKDNGSLQIVYPDLEPHEIPYPCALEVIERNPYGVSLDFLSLCTNRTRQGVQLAEKKVLQRLRIAIDQPLLMAHAEGF